MIVIILIITVTNTYANSFHWKVYFAKCTINLHVSKMIPMCQMFVLEKKLTTKNDIMLHIIKHLALDNKTNKSHSVRRGGGTTFVKTYTTCMNIYGFAYLNQV